MVEKWSPAVETELFLNRKLAVTTQATLSDKHQCIFYMHLPTDRTSHTTTFDGPVADHWLEWKIAQTANAPAMHARSDDPNLYRQVHYRLSYVTPTLS